MLVTLLLLASGVVLASAQFQASLVPAPAPGPEALAPASAVLPASQTLAGPIDPVSTPVLAALVPIAGNVRTDVESGVEQVESGVADIKADWPQIEASFKNRKMLVLHAQDVRAKHVRTLDGKPSLQRLHTQLQEKAQTETAAAVAGAQTQSTGAAAGDTAVDEDTLIEQDLAKIKEDRLKAIQALPRSVWS